MVRGVVAEAGHAEFDLGAGEEEEAVEPSCSAEAVTPLEEEEEGTGSWNPSWRRLKESSGPEGHRMQLALGQACISPLKQKHPLWLIPRETLAG